MSDTYCPLNVGQPEPESPNKVRYTPDILGGGIYPDMPLVDPFVIRRSTVLLSYSDVDHNLSLELRNPELNDQVAIQVQRVHRYSRGDTLDLFRDPNWYKTRVYNWVFTGLTRDQRTSIMEFVLVTAGKFINVTDYYGIEFEAIILNPDNPLTQELPDYKEIKTQMITPTNLPKHYGAGYTWKVDLQRKPNR